MTFVDRLVIWKEVRGGWVYIGQNEAFVMKKLLFRESSRPLVKCDANNTIRQSIFHRPPGGRISREGLVICWCFHQRFHLARERTVFALT
jgi:hypothetical protein